MSDTYTMTDEGLVIPDPQAFGLEGAELWEQPDFRVVLDEFERTRRTYNIHRLILEHIESGRFFETEYSLHEECGFEWEPGCGRDEPPTWTEVFRKEITRFEYTVAR
jgi:hypothetical protein